MAELMTGYVLIDGVAHSTRGLGPTTPGAGGTYFAADGDKLWVHLNGQTYCLEYRDAVTHLGEAAAQAGTMRAPMPGSVIAVSVAAGDIAKAGDAVMIIESMKLETVIRAPHDGVVAAVHFGVGDRFDRDAVLVSLVEAG
jgi:3-methylcrotonyl-CoA carboxylase alpha subunit